MIMKSKLQKIGRIIEKWFWIILAMTAFAVIAAIIGKWMQNKVWIIFVLDVAFCFFLWILLGQEKQFNHGRLSSWQTTKIILSIFAMALILLTLAAATLALLNILLVRLNIIFFIIMTITIVYISLKRRGLD